MERSDIRSTFYAPPAHGSASKTHARTAARHAGSAPAGAATVRRRCATSVRTPARRAAARSARRSSPATSVPFSRSRTRTRPAGWTAVIVERGLAVGRNMWLPKYQVVGFVQIGSEPRIRRAPAAKNTRSGSAHRRAGFLLMAGSMMYISWARAARFGHHGRLADPSPSRRFRCVGRRNGAPQASVKRQGIR